MEFLPVILAIVLVITAIAFFFVRTGYHRKLLITIFITALILELATCSWMSWFFKDGLGPGMVESTGKEAWQYFWEGMIPVVIFLGIISGLNLLGAMFSGRKIKRNC